ncbi:hypothetical protein [Clostridium phage CP3]|nr:hypothetical protein [Clostridium phage CP3]
MDIKFLKDIFSKQCENGDYIILAARKGKEWKDVPIKYNKNNIDKKLKDFEQQYKGYDLYWSPMPYSNPQRRIVNFIETKYLIQDIDEHTDPLGIKPKPSYLWESSPGKYQGLWEMDRYIEANQYDEINPALAKHIGCDSCFDVTHVYRIPGTINYKYKNKPKIKRPIHTKEIYKPKVIAKAVKAVSKSNDSVKVNIGGSEASQSERKIYAKYNIPKKVRDLLALDDITSLDRSSTIWYIENKLHEIGLEPNEIILLVKGSAFNKYKGRKDEETRLRKELDKIIGGEIEADIEKAESTKLRIDSYQDVMGNNGAFPGWLVQGFWGRRSHGIVAGQPKVFKSTFTQDLAISVASGRPFLGQYPVLEPGPVIVVQNENADWIMRDRTEKIISHRGVVGNVDIKGKRRLKVRFAPDLPITFINQQGFMLDEESHRKQIEELIDEIKPVLVIFDPLYLMFSGDLNNAADLNPVLQWCLKLKNEKHTGVMLIHHYNKGGNATQTRGGQKMAGSFILHGWVESALYLKRPDDLEDDDEEIEVDIDNLDKQSHLPSKIIMDREFRLAGQFPQIELNLSMGEFGDPYYHVEVAIPGKEVIVKPEDKAKVIEAVKSGAHTKEEIVSISGLNSQKVNLVLDTLKDTIVYSPDKGYNISKKLNIGRKKA